MAGHSMGTHRLPRIPPIPAVRARYDPPVRRVLLAVLLLLLALPLGGCVERKFLIRSWPEGARVLVNGTPVGATPVEIPFDHYGTVRLEALAVDADGDGWADYRPLTVAHELSAPWYQWFPFDFFSDNLWPGTLVVRRE